MKHGLAIVPFGKYKGSRVRELPDSYLRFLTTMTVLRQEKWHWLAESILAECRWRGFKAEIAKDLKTICREIRQIRTRS